MADKTPIEWTDATWNPVTGCSVVSPGCTNCYAMKLAGTRLKHIPSRRGLTTPSKAGPVWNGKVRFNEEFLLQPLRWKHPRMIFVCAHGDLFAEGVPDEWIDHAFAVMALAPQHTFQVLTKRAQRMRDYVNDPETIHRVYHLACDIAVEHRINVTLIADRSHAAMAPPGPRVYLGEWPLKNVWKGVSAEDQARADERIRFLTETAAVIRWISAEPLLGAIDLERVLFEREHYQSGAHHYVDVLRGGFWSPKPFYRASQDGEPKSHFTNHSDIKDQLIDWVVVGGESGPGARPMHPEWVRSLRDQCVASGVPFFFKQWGAWKPVPWKLEREADETDAQYIERSERECSTHAVSRAGYLAELDHKPWAWGRVLPAPDSHHAVKKVGKAKAGRILDGVTHDAFPKIERIA